MTTPGRQHDFAALATIDDLLHRPSTDMLYGATLITGTAPRGGQRDLRERTKTVSYTRGTVASALDQWIVRWVEACPWTGTSDDYILRLGPDA